MVDNEHIKQIINDSIEQVSNLELVYDGKDIIIKDALIDKLFDEILYNSYLDEHDLIQELSVESQITPINDRANDHCNMRLNNILTDDYYNLTVLKEEISHRYMWILRKLSKLIRDTSKANNLNELDDLI